MAQMCPAKSTIVPFKKQMYSSGSIILSYIDDKCICVSIHAPTRGATIGSNSIMLISKFQSTHPRGVRPISPHRQIGELAVSIHAPTRGATIDDQNQLDTYHVSIHAPTRGATIILLLIKCLLHLFQSTHPRGVRQNLTYI